MAKPTDTTNSKPAPSLTADEAWRAYQEAAAAFNSLVGKEKLSNLVVAKAAMAAADFVKSYRDPSNWRDGAPIFPFPRDLADDVERNIKLVLSGHIPTWMVHLGRRGAPKIDPRVVKCITTALSFKRFCETGHIKQDHPVKVIAEKYGVDRKTVQRWEKDYRLGTSVEEDWARLASLDDELTDEICAKLVAASLDEYAARYRAYGRGPKNPRADGKAGPRRPRRAAT